MPPHTFTATTALITGASQGVGEALARDLAGRGADLVLVARSSERLDVLAEQLRLRHNHRVEVVVADLTDRQAHRVVMEELDRRGLVVDLLINNAGMGAVGPFLERPLEPNLQSVDLNITALVGLTYSIGNRMLGRRSGGIINVASVAGFQPMPYQASYGATKAFVLSFSEAIREELRPSGIRVMAAHPGPVATGFFDGTTAAIAANAVDPAVIAANVLDDFVRGRSISFPGHFSDRATTVVSRVLPRTVVARIVKSVNRRNGYHRVVDLLSPPTPHTAAR